jgi:hypothetical protein
MIETMSEFHLPTQAEVQAAYEPDSPPTFFYP